MFRIALVGSLTILFAGCAVREANMRIFERQRPVNDQERKAIIEHIRTTYFDPYSVRDAEISHSAPSAGIDASITYLVCVKSNAKNRFGAYVGRTSSIFYFDSLGKITNTLEESYGFCENPQLRYSPFPEAERIGERK
jgi:hypothetical protein